jgi:hypothetical protein
MKKEINYKIKTEIAKDLPEIEIQLNYKDDFSNDKYILRSTADYKNGSQLIPFKVYKNGDKLGEVELSKEDYENMFIKFFDKVDDVDFEDEFFHKEILSLISDELTDFMKSYKEEVIDNRLTLEGEKKRMKRMAGIL